MNKKVYVCTGTCAAEISEEQYNAGLKQCGAKDCNMKGHQFEERLKCGGECQAIATIGEEHHH